MSPKRWAPAKRASASAMARKRWAAKRASSAAIAPKRSAASPPPGPLEISSESSSESSSEEEEEKPANVESEQETSDEEEEAADDEMLQAAAKRRNPLTWVESEQETSEEEEEEEVADDEMLQTKATSVAAMAPNRLAAPTPPLPPVASSEKTATGSGAEEEKEIVPSLPPAAPKSRLLDLGKNVLPSSSKAAANSGAGREPDEMCELYPCLAEEVKAIQKEHPGLFKREFGMMEDSEARALEEEIRKQRLSQMRLRTKVTKTLLDLAE